MRPVFPTSYYPARLPCKKTPVFGAVLVINPSPGIRLPAGNPKKRYEIWGHHVRNGMQSVSGKNTRAYRLYVTLLDEIDKITEERANVEKLTEWAIQGRIGKLPQGKKLSGADYERANQIFELIACGGKWNDETVPALFVNGNFREMGTERVVRTEI